jgi:hypothetical protein
MAGGFDIGLSVAGSSAAQSGGEFSTGDIIVGGSGGANKTPTWLFLALGGLGLLLLFWFLLRGKRGKR